MALPVIPEDYGPDEEVPDVQWENAPDDESALALMLWEQRLKTEKYALHLQQGYHELPSFTINV